MKTSDQGVKLIAKREGVRQKAYLDSRGLLTVGVGHLVQPGEPYVLGQTIALTEVYRLLKQDLAITESVIADLVTVPLTQNQFDALTSFIFNIGRKNFQRSATLKRLNNKDYKGAASGFMNFTRAGKDKNILAPRRRDEMAQFLSADSEVPAQAPESSNGGAKDQTNNPPAPPIQDQPSEAQSPSVPEKTASEIANEYTDAVIHWSDRASEVQASVSRSSWLVALGQKIFGGVLILLSFRVSNWEMTLVGLVLVGFGIWYLTHAKNRATQRQEAALWNSSRREVK